VALPPGAMADPGLVVPVIDAPSLEAFMTGYMLAPGAAGRVSSFEWLTVAPCKCGTAVERAQHPAR
jgi:hypothetical protein